MLENVRQSKAFQTAGSILKVLFLALSGLYLFYATSKTTTFGLPWPAGFEKTLLKVMAATALLRLLTTRLKRWETLVALGLAMVYLMVYRQNHYGFILVLALMTVGLIDIDYRQILKVYLLTVGTVYCTAVLAGMIGAIPSYIRIKDGLRNSWGLNYPTDFASLGLFLSLALWVCWKRLPDWAMLFIALGSTALSWFIAHSYTSTLCGLLFLLAILYHMVERGVVARHPRLKRLEEVANWAVMLTFPICALAVFALMMLYGRGTNLGYRANTLMSNRLRYAMSMWKKCGSRLFGTPFVQAGEGSSNFSPEKYTFIDISYLLILVRYGWVMLIATCLSWIRIARKAIRCADRRLLLVMGIIALHAFSEHHFVQCHFNILIVMSVAAYAAKASSGELSGRPERKGAGRLDRYGEGVSPSTIVIVALFAGAACLTGPAVLSRLKTALELKGLCGGGKGLALFGVFFGLLCALLALLWGLDAVVKAVIARKRLRACGGALAALLMGLGVMIGAWSYAGGVLDAAMAEDTAIPQADRQALEIAVAASDNGVYSGILPSLYAKSVDGMRCSAFFADDLSRLRGSTALMEAGEEHNAFFDSGCLYAQVSDAHAIYTSDRKVIEALTGAGYHLTGYYNSAQNVSLKAAATANDLAYDDGRGLLLEGARQALNNGPYKGLYGGKYTVSFELLLPAGASTEAGVVCTLGVTTYEGKNTLLKREIRREEFDDESRLTVSIPFTIRDTRGVGFCAEAQEGRTVCIESIRYRRTPDYDLHTLYDSRLRKVREEYHTLEGAATMGPNGYYAVEYGYDGNKNVNLIRYYNQNDELTLHTAGYAELRRVFNANRKIIREEYYGTDGRPIALTSRQAAVEMEYDADGNASVVRYYGVDGNPVITTGGYAQVHRAFNENRQVIQEAYYGIAAEPVPLASGEYSIEQEFDDEGNVAVRRFYGEDGKPRMRSDGYAEVRWQYNGMHQIVREEFYDADGQPAMIAGGYAADERAYDDAGNVTVYRYYGLDGEPVVTRSGYAELHRQFNARRQVVREAYYGADGLPIALYGGQYSIENDYDDAGNVSIRRFYDEKGEKARILDGYAEVHWRYNAMRQVVREEFYGTDGQPIAINTGAAADECEYDGNGNVIAYRYYGTDGRPTVIVSGYAELHREYNDKRQIVREAYFGADGRPMAQPEGHCSVEQSYDDMGNIAVQKYCGEDGRPIVTTKGYAEVRRVYNNVRQVIREAYFDEAGAPLARAAGHAAIEQEYDGDGKLAARRYLDADGNAVQRTDGYAEARWTRDPNTGVRNVTFYDLAGNEIPPDGLNLMQDIPDGWSGWYTPRKDTINITFNIASINLGEKSAGDSYAIYLEIEFSDVSGSPDQEFMFIAQGATDGVWEGRNIWNSSLVDMRSAPEDGVYEFSAVSQIGEGSAGIDVFDIGFRCDNWAGGAFRVRNVKIEKGDAVSAWSPGI